MVESENKSRGGLPRHIGFIVDGNRRWAKERGLPTLDGHRTGFDKVEKIAVECVKKGVKYVSFYLFSTENWGRSEEEVSYLMKLVETNIARMIKRLKKEDIKCVILGRKEPTPEKVWRALKKAEEETCDGKAGTVCICFNYGGKWEIADAVSEIIEKMGSGAPRTEITPEIVAEHLYRPEVPELDLVVRTSGEERISGFMLWRAAYAELLFLKKYFPDMEVDDVKEILEEFSRRQRRFGK